MHRIRPIRKPVRTYFNNMSQKLKALLWLCCAPVFLSRVYGQDTTQCAQNLIDAQTLFTSGKLNQVTPKLENCLVAKKGGFTKDERVQAYKLLSVTDTYLEEYAKADLAVLNLLRTENEYQVNPEIDPTEFIKLYQKFRNYPIFQVGLRAGLNASMFSFGRTFESAGNPSNAGIYKGQLGFTGALDFEIPLRSLNDNIELSPSLLYNNMSYALSLGPLANEQGYSYTGTETQTWLDLVATGRYLFKKPVVQNVAVAAKKTSNYIPFVEAGLSLNYLNKAQISNPAGKFGTSYEQPATIDMTSYRKKMNFGVIVGAGVKTDIPMGIIELRLDYNYALNQTNIIKLLPTTLTDLGINYEPAEFRIHYFTLTVVYMRKIYKPKKIVE